ncbi:MAG: Holliday junction branch migration DNA helicase RuvB, partial [Thermotogae bacterium]
MELDNERFLSPGELKEDFVINCLRPTSLEEYIGQKNVKERLQIAIEAARVR